MIIDETCIKRCIQTAPLVARKAPAEDEVRVDEPPKGLHLLSQCIHIRSSDLEYKPVPLRSLMTRRFVIPLINSGCLAFVDQCSSVLLPLYWSTSTPLGGLGFSPFKIGAIMGTYGCKKSPFINLYLL
jgi:hypothetical protein